MSSPTPRLIHLSMQFFSCRFFAQSLILPGKNSSLAAKAFPSQAWLLLPCPSAPALSPQHNVHCPTTFPPTRIVHTFLPVRITLILPSLPSTRTVLWAYQRAALFPSLLQEASSGHHWPLLPTSSPSCVRKQSRA